MSLIPSPAGFQASNGDVCAWPISEGFPRSTRCLDLSVGVPWKRAILRLVLISCLFSVGQVYDPEIMAFRPQRYSLASSKSSLSWNSFESPPSSLRSSAASLATLASSPSFNSLETPSVLPHSSRHSTFISQQKVRSTGPPTPVFHRLPSEVYDCVLQQIENFHNEPASMSCHTCYLRDMCALALTNRRWDRAVRSRL